MSRPLVICGAGGHARETALIARQTGQAVVGFIDERSSMKGVVVDGLPVLGAFDDVSSGIAARCAFLAGGVGDPAVKRRFAAAIDQRGWRHAEPLMHPSAQVGEAILGRGVVVAANVIMTVNVLVAEHVTVNRAVNLSHDSRVGPFSTISPGAQICGNVELGSSVYVGVGASIREKVTVGAGAVIGGGSFVAADVDADVIVGGVPARPLKRGIPR